MEISTYIGFTDIGNGSNNDDDDSAPLAMKLMYSWLFYLTATGKYL